MPLWAASGQWTEPKPTMGQGTGMQSREAPSCPQLAGDAGPETPGEPAVFPLPRSLCPRSCVIPSCRDAEPCEGSLAWGLCQASQVCWGASRTQEWLIFGWDRKLKPASLIYAALVWNLA
uniref:Uncharacterized protein n=1 Tax=Macaca nemestrina TaxID=9545 RepID=A0A2K6ATG7_MACNE